MFTNIMSGHEQMRSTATATRPKRSNAKTQAPKKPPQRGLGVAQLERLRIQERLSKMTGMNPDFNLLNAALEPSPAMGGGAGIIPLTPPGFSASPTTYHQQQLIGSAGSSPGGFFPSAAAGIPSGGLEGMPRSGGGRYFGNLPIDHGEVVVSGRVVSGPLGVVGSDLRNMVHLQQGVCSFDATLREVSTRPNDNGPVEPCEFCIKKKRIDEQNVDFNRSLRNIVSYPETTKIINNNNNVGRDYIGLNHHPQHGQGQGHGHFLSNSGLNLGARDSTSAFKSYRNPNQAGEVKGGAQNQNNKMKCGTSREHDFFPGIIGRSTLSKEQVFPAVGVVPLNPEEASNSIDLTLRL